MCIIVEMSNGEAMKKGWDPTVVTLQEFERFYDDVDGFERYISKESDRLYPIRSLRGLDFVAKRDEEDDEEPFADVRMRTDEQLVFSKYNQRKKRSQKRKDTCKWKEHDHKIVLKAKEHTLLTNLNWLAERKFVVPDSRCYRQKMWRLLNRAVRQQGSAICWKMQRVSDSDEYDDLTYLTPKEVVRLRALPDELTLEKSREFHY